MDSVMKCEIVSMEHRLFTGEATFVSVPALPGAMGFYPKHSPVIAPLGSGLIKIVNGNEAEPIQYVVRGGYVENDGQRVTILADYAENLADLSVEGLKKKIAGIEEKLAAIDEGYKSRIRLTTQDLEWNKKLLSMVESQ